MRDVQQGLDHTGTHEEFSSSDCQGLTSFNLLEVLWSLSVSVAVEQLSVFDSHCVDHGVAIKPVVSSVRWNKFGVWSISEVHSVDVVRNFAIDNINHFVRLLLSNWSEVAF